MKKMLEIMVAAALILSGAFAHATACGTTTVSSTGVVDSDSLTWANGTFVANLVLPPQVFNPAVMQCTTAGNTFAYQYSGTLNSSGALSVALPSNTNLAPGGSQWAITVCPNATRGCYTYTTTISGSTQSITTALNAVLPGPRFTTGQSSMPYGYGTVELTSTIPTGTIFYNTTTNTQQIYNAITAAWTTVNPSGYGTDANGNITTPYATLVDDFCGNTPATTTTIGQLGWDKTVVVAGTNPVAAVASVAGHPCLITLTTDITATNGVSISLGHAVGVLFPGASANWQSKQTAEVNQVATGSYRVGYGTVDAATAIPANGIYFRFLQGTDTYINACFDVSSTETCTATTVAPTAADYVDFLMNSTTTGAVSFTVTDLTTPATSTVTLCPSGCTAAATAPTGVLSPFYNIVNTDSSTADILTVDLYAFQQALSR